MIWKDVLSCHGTDDDVCDGDGDEWRCYRLFENWPCFANILRSFANQRVLPYVCKPLPWVCKQAWKFHRLPGITWQSLIKERVDGQANLQTTVVRLQTTAVGLQTAAAGLQTVIHVVRTHTSVVCKHTSVVCKHSSVVCKHTLVVCGCLQTAAISSFVCILCLVKGHWVVDESLY